MFGKFGKLFGKVDGIIAILAGLGKDIADIKSFIADGLKLWADVKAGQAEIKGILTPGPTASATAGSVVVPAPPAGHVLVAVPAEHAAALPDALASIVAQQSASMAGVGPPK